MWIIIQISFAVICVITFCQKITLEKPQRISSCSTGLLDQNDKFLLNGAVTENAPNHFALGWQDKLDIEILTKASGLFSVCDIPLTAAQCRPDNSLLCYCSKVDSQKGVVHFVINHTALAELSQGIIRAHWKYNDTHSIYSNNQTLPGIYSMTEAELKLTFYGATGSLKLFRSCNYQVTLDLSNHLTVCCSSPLTPCYPQVSFNEDFVTNKSCVSYPESELASDKVTGNLELTYSLCVQTDQKSEDICTVTYKSAKPRTDTTLPSEQSTTGSTSETLKSSTDTADLTNRDHQLLTTEAITQASIARFHEKDFLTKFVPGLCLSAISVVIALVYFYCTHYFCKKPAPVSVETADQEKITNTRPEREGTVEEHGGTIFE